MFLADFISPRWHPLSMAHFKFSGIANLARKPDFDEFGMDHYSRSGLMEWMQDNHLIIRPEKTLAHF